MSIIVFTICKHGWLVQAACESPKPYTTKRASTKVKDICKTKNVFKKYEKDKCKAETV